jgi:hypothetical protein
MRSALVPVLPQVVSTVNERSRPDYDNYETWKDLLNRS